jgi:hypothetical protein
MIDLITVVFRDEVPALKIQARSIDEYVSVDDINCITVVVNDDVDVIDLIDTAWWGRHQSKVVIVPRSFDTTVLGWESQQLCKLLAAADSKSPWSMVLDSKTWFIRSLEMTKLFDPAGRVQVGVLQVSPHFIPSQQFVEKFYNVKLDQIIGPAGVPFMFHTETVTELIAGIENFVDFFLTNVRYPNLITEFYLYSGYVLSKYGNYNTLYTKTQHYIPFNIAHWEPAKFNSFKQYANSPYVITASIHRGAYTQLTEDQKATWTEFLIQKKLLNN